MKKEFVMWLIIAVLVVGLLVGTQKAETMAIDFAGADKGQLINFGAVSAVQGATAKSISFWVYQDTYEADAYPIVLFNDGVLGANSSFALLLNYSNNGDVLFSEEFSGAPDYAGIWITTSGGYVATGGYHNVIITYDKSSTANDPIIYVDGESRGVTESVTPSGSAPAGTTSTLKIGGADAAANFYPIDGRISQPRVFNRILTADEVLQIYNGRGRDNIHNGEVFCPFDRGAAGLQAFDGATLAAGNTIVDPCSGAVGVPAGSPVGVGETYLR